MTTIEWTDESWNPLRAFAPGGAVTRHGWACVRVSQGCVNCYAATFNKRLGTGLDYTVPALAKVKTYLDEKALKKPSSWRKPRRVFVCSMTDLFGDWVSDAQILDVWLEMAANPRHTFQVLTKRPERMREWVNARFTDAEPLRNVWLGASVEGQEAADDRIPHLLATRAAVRFLSCEPLLERVTIEHYLWRTLQGVPIMGAGYRRNELHWVIVGGESGHGARPFDLAWARSLVSECRRGGVTPFVKQMGSNAQPSKMREGHGRDMAEWPEDLRIREWPVAA